MYCLRWNFTEISPKQEDKFIIAERQDVELASFCHSTKSAKINAANLGIKCYRCKIFLRRNKVG